MTHVSTSTISYFISESSDVEIEGVITVGCFPNVLKAAFLHCLLRVSRNLKNAITSLCCEVPYVRPILFHDF